MTFPGIQEMFCFFKNIGWSLLHINASRQEIHFVWNHYFMKAMKRSATADEICGCSDDVMPLSFRNRKQTRKAHEVTQIALQQI